MMFGTFESSLDMDKLSRLLEEELKQSNTLVAELMRGGGSRMDGTRCTLQNSMQELLRMVQQSHHTPMMQHRQAVKRVLMDHDYVPYETGDIHMRLDEMNTSRIDKLAGELVDLLERVRLQAINTGNWSDRLNPYEFFG